MVGAGAAGDAQRPCNPAHERGSPLDSARTGSGSGRIGLIGAGALARALVRGFLATGWPAADLWVTNRADDERLAALRGQGLQATRDLDALTGAVDLLLLLTKPKDAPMVLEALRDRIGPGHRLISCMAGVSTQFIESTLGGVPRVLRAMPNLASAVGASATALAPGRYAEPSDVDAAVRLLRTVGEVVTVEEGMLDAVTAVAGSGPAYVFLLMEAMTEGAAALGLPGPVARALVAQTVSGAARLVTAGEGSPAQLRQAVSSPGGTTLAGLGVLEEGGLRRLVALALLRATERSRALGQGWDGPAASHP